MWKEVTMIRREAAPLSPFPLGPSSRSRSEGAFVELSSIDGTWHWGPSVSGGVGVKKA